MPSNVTGPDTVDQVLKHIRKHTTQVMQYADDILRDLDPDKMGLGRSITTNKILNSTPQAFHLESLRPYITVDAMHSHCHRSECKHERP